MVLQRERGRASMCFTRYLQNEHAVIIALGSPLLVTRKLWNATWEGLLSDLARSRKTAENQEKTTK